MGMDVFNGLFESTVMVSAASVLIKLGIAVILGGLIGWEREVHGRPAGLRTHMLMVLGVVLISEVSRNFGGGDPSRIASQIVTGVGFLGAGTIMRLGPEVKGLTSAASIWATAGIGMAVSTGGAFLWVAIVATLLCLFTLSVVDRLERRVLPTLHPNNYHLVLESRDALSAVVGALAASGVTVTSLAVAEENNTVTANMGVTGGQNHVIETIVRLPGVISASKV